MSRTRDSDEHVEYESVAVRSDQAIVRLDDLLHCVQVAVWRAGELDREAFFRLKEALGIGPAEGIPKPPHRHG